MSLTNQQIDQIKADQGISLKEVISQVGGTDNKKNNIVRNMYAQIFRGINDWWVDVLSGPKGYGFVIMEEKVELGKTYRKATGFGAEKEWRTHDWREITILN